MNFYKAILKWKDKGESCTNARGNELICHVHKQVKDDYLHVLFYSLDKKNQKLFDKEFNKKDNPGLRKYKDFIFEHNGAVLYSGAIVLFGYTNDNSINTFIEPASLSRMNSKSRFIRDNSVYLYIGNIMHRDLDNIDVYINRKTGYILWMHKNEIFKEFETIEKMLQHILEYYEPHYKENGENKNYNNRKKNVYENIQLY